MRVAAINDGTTKNPPPMPKKPENIPVNPPKVTSFGAFSRLNRTLASPQFDLLRNISAATVNINSANSANNFCPSTNIPNDEPPNAPATPAAANTRAQRHFTFPARAWLITFAPALTATARALVPIATCGLVTPTTYTISGTAKMEPPPPTKPRVSPTSDPDAAPSTICNSVKVTI